MKVQGKKLETLRGRLIVHRGRDIQWREFARLCKLTPSTICSLLNGRSGGRMQTVDKIVEGLRSQGLNVDRQDVLSE